MAEMPHFFDIEFCDDLKEKIIKLFPQFEESLRKCNIVKDSYKETEAIYLDYDSQAERFWITHKADIKEFLLAEKDYECNGTSVWLQLAEEKDVEEYFEKLIKEFEVV